MEALQMMAGSPNFAKYVPEVKKILADPNKSALIASAIKRTNDAYWVLDPLDMLLELAGREFSIEEHILNHRKTIAVAASTADKEYLFNTDEATAGLGITNIQTSNKMAKNSVFFFREIALDLHQDALLAERERIDKECNLIIKFQNQEYLKIKAMFIPGIRPDEIRPVMDNAGAAAAASTFFYTRGAKTLKLNRFFKLPEDTDFSMFLDFGSATATALACDVEISLHGIKGSKK